MLFNPSFEWLRCGGALDAFAAIDKESPIGIARGRFEEYVAHLVQTPFAWLVIADPLSPRELKSSMEKIALELPYLENYGKNEAKKLTFERARAQYHEKARSESAGMWNIHVLVGGEASDVAGVAALLCNASDISQLPYLLRPGEKIDLSKDIININQATEKNFDRPEIASPFDGSTELLCAIARPPVVEIPGVRLVTPHTFDVTEEKQDCSKRSVSVNVGTVRDVGLESAGLFSVTSDTLVRHTFVCGATGAGKSQTVRKLLEELTRQHIPWLVIEPAKAEYALMARRLEGTSEVFAIRPGELDAIPASLNPLEPEEGFPLQTHIDLVRALFLAAFEAEEPFPQILSRALTECYQGLGWDLVLSKPKNQDITPKYPDLGDLQKVAQEVVGKIGYGDEVKANVKGFVDVRIGSLRLGTPGRFFSGGHPLKVAELLERNVVIELEDIGNDQDKAFLIGTVLIRLYEHLRMREKDEQAKKTESLSHITVIEEAHRLLKNVMERSPAAHAVELFAGLLAEIRAYREGLVVAEQIPSKILPDVIKNTALKVVHRLPAKDDRDSVGATMNLSDEQSQYVVSLKPGWAAVFTDGMDHPLLALMDNTGEAKEKESKKLATRVYGSNVPLCTSRSQACGKICREQRLCTLREINQAARLAEDPQLSLWVEMAIVALIIGEPEPKPKSKWFTEVKAFAAKNQRVLECAVGQLAQSAIDTRYDCLAVSYQPERLAHYVANRLMTQLQNGTESSESIEEKWKAGPFRWYDVAQALTKVNVLEANSPHPDTEKWKKQGLSLQGHTCDEQLFELERDPAFKLSPITTVYGKKPYTIEIAVGKLSSASKLSKRFEEALFFLDFSGSYWPNWKSLCLYSSE
jgi:hypothetical protein